MRFNTGAILHWPFHQALKGFLLLGGMLICHTLSAECPNQQIRVDLIVDTSGSMLGVDDLSGRLVSDLQSLGVSIEGQFGWKVGANRPKRFLDLQDAVDWIDSLQRGGDWPLRAIVDSLMNQEASDTHLVLVLSDGLDSSLVDWLVDYQVSQENPPLLFLDTLPLKSITGTTWNLRDSMKALSIEEPNVFLAKEEGFSTIVLLCLELEVMDLGLFSNGTEIDIPLLWTGDASPANLANVHPTWVGSAPSPVLSFNPQESVLSIKNLEVPIGGKPTAPNGYIDWAWQGGAGFLFANRLEISSIADKPVCLVEATSPSLSTRKGTGVDGGLMALSISCPDDIGSLEISLVSGPQNLRIQAKDLSGDVFLDIGPGDNAVLGDGFEGDLYVYTEGDSEWSGEVEMILSSLSETALFSLEGDRARKDVRWVWEIDWSIPRCRIIYSGADETKEMSLSAEGKVATLEIPFSIDCPNNINEITLSLDPEGLNSLASNWTVGFRHNAELEFSPEDQVLVLPGRIDDSLVIEFSEPRKGTGYFVFSARAENEDVDWAGSHSFTVPFRVKPPIPKAWLLALIPLIWLLFHWTRPRFKESMHLGSEGNDDYGVCLGETTSVSWLKPWQGEYFSLYAHEGVIMADGRLQAEVLAMRDGAVRVRPAKNRDLKIDGKSLPRGFSLWSLGQILSFEDGGEILLYDADENLDMEGG